MNERCTRVYRSQRRWSLPRWVFLSALVGSLSQAVSLNAEVTEGDVYVSTQGDDSWSGTLATPNSERTDGPVATVERARQLVRAIRNASPERRGAVRVLLRGGTYYLTRTLELTPEDSGSESSPVVYEAYGTESPILSAGSPVSSWEVGSDGRWRTRLEEVRDGKWSFAQLFVNDQRRYRPRLPREGYHRVAESLSPSPQAGNRGFDRFRFGEGEIVEGWSNLQDVEVIPFHQWSASRLRIAEVDPTERVVRFTGTTVGTSGWASFGNGHRYLVVNVKEALGRPGDWYLDRPSGELTYVPREGENPRDARVIAPRLTRAVTLAGDPGSKRWVEHVEFRGLTFAHTNWVLPPEGQAYPQADIGLDAAISAIGARHISFQHCAVRHVGAYAMAFGLGSRHNRIVGCELVDMGGGGIKVGHSGTGSWGDVGQVPSDDELVVSHHTIEDCLIAHGGRLHPASVGVWIGHSPYNKILHNDIHDFYYTGVSIGWIWGYSPSKAHHNELGWNHVHTLGQGVLSDMGGVYTLGISPGTEIHDNHFHDVYSFSYGGWGLYTDEGSSQIVLRNNLVYRTKTGGFHQHYGRENRVENNILGYGTEHQIQRTRTEEHISFFFERNIVIWDNASPLLGSNWRDDNFRMAKNLYWNEGGHPIRFPGDLSLEEWQQKRGQDEGSQVADPLFLDPKKGDYRLKDASPALELGFKRFDGSKAGRRMPPKLVAELPPVPPGFE